MAQSDGTPGDGRYPTSRWQVGEVVRERHEFAVASNAPAGPLDVRVGWYRVTGSAWTRLATRDSAGSLVGDSLVLAQVMIPRRPLPPDPANLAIGSTLPDRIVGRAGRAIRGDRAPDLAPVWAVHAARQWIPFGHRIMLAGWAIDRDATRPGESVRVALDFEPRDRIDDDLAVFVHLVDPGGRLVAQSDSVPVSGGLPTLRWAPGRRVRDIHRLVLSDEVPAGRYRLQAGLYAVDTGRHLGVLDDERARLGQGDHVVLTEIEVR
jgi:hypothetical protein